jgi:hypothetical protein
MGSAGEATAGRIGETIAATGGAELDPRPTAPVPMGVSAAGLFALE